MDKLNILDVPRYLKLGQAANTLTGRSPAIEAIA